MLACLALGLLINMLTAWACAMRADPYDIRFYLLDQADPAVIDPAELDVLRAHPAATLFSDDHLAVGVERRIGLERRAATTIRYWEAMTTAMSQEWTGPEQGMFDLRIRAGWPLRALEGSRTEPGSTPADRFRYRWLWRIGSMEANPYQRGQLPLIPRFLLPLKPLWPGFAINTLMYAALVWLLLFAPLALRRAVRRRRNRCECCGYPRGTSSVCSECGAALRDAALTPRARNRNP